MDKPNYSVTFWGVRGSRPVPGDHTLKYGGNTSCVQIQIGDHIIILDAGTGICNLGNHLIKENKIVKADIFITHVHWDHIQGFPFFKPAYVKGNSFYIYGEGKGDIGFMSQMSGIMKDPHFPVNIDHMVAHLEFVEIENGQEIILKDGITVTTVRNNHPNGSISYRIDYQGKSCCYITDTEHCEEEIDLELLKFIDKADMVIYDANYTDEEYLGINGLTPKRGWGHSTWQEGIKLAKAANVKQLVLFHHDSERTDIEMEAIERQAQSVFKNCIAAREGLKISLL